MKINIILFLLLLSCKPDVVDSAVYDPNLQKVFDLWKLSQTCKTAKIDEYSFQSEKVYVFDPGTCGADMTSPVYDSKGVAFCSLGGLIGNIKCKNINFDTNSKFIRTIWKK